MIVATSIIVSLVIALLCGGKISLLAQLRFRAPYLLLGTMGLRLLLALPVFSQFWCMPALNLFPYGGLAYTTSLFLLLLMIALNLSLPGLKLIGLGLLSNLLVITLNGGQMPGDPTKLAATGFSQDITRCETSNRWSNFTFIDEKTRLWFLGDHFLVPRPWPLPTVISVGDLVLMAGVFYFFQKVLTSKVPGQGGSTKGGT